MIITDYASFRQYFANLAFAHPDLKVQGDGSAFVWYDDDFRLNNERSHAEYPALHVERPEITATILRGGSHDQVWSCAMAVVMPASWDDYPAQEEALEVCQVILDQLLARIDFDRIAQDETFRIIPLRNILNDGLWGWEVEWTMDVKASYCHEASEWQALRRMKPVWTIGQTSLDVTIAGTDFSQAWTDSLEVKAALEDLATAIRADSINAYVDGETLVILSPQGQNYSILSTTGHTWTTLSTWLSA